MSRTPWLVLAVLAAASAEAAPSRNLFANPGFELGGTGPWRMDKGGKTAARFELAREGALEGQRAMRVTVGAVESYGTQFGQVVDAGAKGRTYTLAVMVKPLSGPLTVDLQIERPAKPYDRALRGRKVALPNGKWTEVRETFTVASDFAQGWFAYISCGQANARYLADAFRLYEGDYVPYQQAAKAEAAAVGVRLFDTGSASAQPLAAEALAKRPGWTQGPEDETGHRFKGDAVMMNNRLAVVLRKRGRGAEAYSNGARRAHLTPFGSARAAKLVGLKIAENGSGGASIDARFAAPTGSDMTIRYALGMGQAFVATEPRGGVTGLRVEAPCRFAVLPDFFADDIVLDAAELPVAKAELPGDNFLLHLLGDGDGIAMAVWDRSDQDVGVTLSGKGERRAIDASAIRYGEKGKVWVAFFDGQGVWHRHDVADKDAGRIVPLDWAQPFPAQWRLDWRRADAATDSWEMIAQRADGKFTKHGWFGSPGTLPANRKRWTTVLGSFPYPCWVDRDGRGHLQPFAKKLRFEGPAVIYPINRVRATPLDTFTVVDIVRATLGVGPCEYILDVEGQRSRNKGRATCSTRDTLNPIYQRRQQKQQRAKIERTLDEVMVFIRHIRGRIEEYVAFGHGVLDLLAEHDALGLVGARPRAPGGDRRPGHEHDGGDDDADHAVDDRQVVGAGHEERHAPDHQEGDEGDDRLLRRPYDDEAGHDVQGDEIADPPRRKIGDRPL